VKRKVLGLVLLLAGVGVVTALAAYAQGGDSQPSSISQPTESGDVVTGHFTPDSKRSLDVVGSKGTTLRVKATHSVYDSGGGLTEYELAWPDGSSLGLAQEDACVGANNIISGTMTSETGTNAYALVPSWLDDAAGLTQGGRALETERFRIEGFADIMVAPDAVKGQLVELSGIDRSAVYGNLGCASGGPGK
jgi:hypothetical protein